MEKRGKKVAPNVSDEGALVLRRKDEAWDDRLRRVGDANYIPVDWATRDRPSWPLPVS